MNNQNEMPQWYADHINGLYKISLKYLLPILIIFIIIGIVIKLNLKENRIENCERELAELKGIK